MSAMAIAVHHHDTVDAFLEAVGPFLANHEAENNLILGIASAIHATPEVFEERPTFATAVDDGGQVVAATLRTPPHNQVLSWTDVPATSDALAYALRDQPLPGLLGPTEAAAAFVEEWTRTTGRSARIEVAERIFRLERVSPPRRPAPGRWRVMDERDRDLMASWVVAFTEEAVPESPPIPDPMAVAYRWVAQVGRIGYVWEASGSVVSFVGASGSTPNGMRIGPVYTPPEQRRRGYASALTAAASQDQLDRGRRFTFLFTDLSNPTSNKIYRAIGYEPVCDMDQYRFDDA